MSGVGGVEPETVTTQTNLARAADESTPTVEPGRADQPSAADPADPRKLIVVLQSLDPDAPPPVAHAVVLRDDYDAVASALRLAEEELRQAREERDAMEREANRAWSFADTNLESRERVRADRDARSASLQMARNSQDSLQAQYDEAHAGWDACAELLEAAMGDVREAEADRDRLAAERDAAVRELELHKKARLAHRAAEARAAALSPVQGEHEQDGEDAGVVGDSALPGESVRGAIDPALIRASATDAVAKRDAIRRRLARLDNGEYSVLEMVDDLESLLRHPLWEQCHQAAQDVERLSDEIAAVRNNDSEATR